MLRPPSFLYIFLYFFVYSSTYNPIFEKCHKIFQTPNPWWQFHMVYQCTNTSLSDCSWIILFALLYLESQPSLFWKSEKNIQELFLFMRIIKIVATIISHKIIVAIFFYLAQSCTLAFLVEQRGLILLNICIILFMYIVESTQKCRNWLDALVNCSFN